MATHSALQGACLPGHGPTASAGRGVVAAGAGTAAARSITKEIRAVTHGHTSSLGLGRATDALVEDLGGNSSCATVQAGQDPTPARESESSRPRARCHGGRPGVVSVGTSRGAATGEPRASRGASWRSDGIPDSNQRRIGCAPLIHHRSVLVGARPPAPSSPSATREGTRREVGSSSPRHRETRSDDAGGKASGSPVLLTLSNDRCRALPCRTPRRSRLSRELRRPRSVHPAGAPPFVAGGMAVSADVEPWARRTRCSSWPPAPWCRSSGGT
jgi:hypothetical protein